MKRSADIVVIGGGVVGCSIAYQLAKMGQRNVVIVEKNQVASGASGRCPGGFRQQWSTKADILLMSASIRMFMQLQDELEYPGDLEIRQIGYLFLLYTEEEMQQFRENVALQRSLGVPTDIISPRDAKSLAPFLDISGVVGGTFCPLDGRGSPLMVTHAYASAARRLGVEINTSTAVTGLITADGRISKVVTDRGTIDAPVVVGVAGAHTRDIARMVGLDLPIRPSRREAMVTERFDRPQVPALMSDNLGYFQTPNGDILPDMRPPNVETFEISGTRGFLSRTATAWAKLLPPLAGVRVIRHWAGYYDMTPDAHPIVGAIPGIEGLYVAAGFSGHGFMMAPIIGKAMAEMLLGLPPSIDISELQSDRFARGGHAAEVMVY